MAEKCLRNASCKCSMCAGFDVVSLMSISKSISSNIQYEDESEGQEPPPPSIKTVMNSPPVVARKTFVSNSPPIPAVKTQLPAPMEVEAQAQTLTPNADVAMASPDSNMEVVASTLSNLDMDTQLEAANGAVSVDALLPKLTDKNWKVRKEAFEDAKTLFEQRGVKTQQVRPVMELFTKMCEDANASALEAGIAAVLAYTLNVQPFDKEIVGRVMAKVTDKGFSSRPGIVKLCEELTDAFIAAGAAEETVTALLEGTNNKKPKVPPACASCILEALKDYGPRVVPLQAIKTALPKMLEGAVKVRPVAMNMMVEIYRWTGPALVQDIVSNLRPAQQTEFTESTKDVVVGQAAPTKFIRGAKSSAPAAGGGRKASTGASGVAAAPAPAFDPREFAETVDLLAKLPKTEFKKKLELPKWSEKVEALKIVLDLIGSVPKLADGDYYELVATLKPLVNDSNVNIAAKSIEVFGALADGLRKSFTQFARQVFPDILRKLSDKKTVILIATNSTLDLFLQHAMTIDVMMEDLKLACDASKNKAPAARVQTMSFLARAVDKKYVDLNDKALVVTFGGLFTKGIDDTDPTVRKAGQEALIVLLKATDQTGTWLQNVMDDIARKNPRAYKAIQKELSGSSTSAPPSRPGSARSSRPGSAASSRHGSAPPSRPASNAGSEVADEDVEMTAPAPAQRPSLKKRGPPSRLGGKPGAATAKPAPSRKPSAGTGGTGASGDVSTDFSPMAISVSPEEAEDILVDLDIENWGAVQAGFASSKWMERKAAIEAMEEYAKTQSNLMSMRVIEAFTAYLSKQVKEFKDSNINVLKSSFQAVGTYAENAASKFPRGVVCLVVPRACDKIADRKANEVIKNMLMQLCEATSPSYTTGCMIEYMPKVRTPLAHIEALAVLTECVNDFGIAICNPRALVEYAKGPLGLEGSNPKVRSGATSLLSAMYAQLGPALLPILNLESWKPALASTVEEEFKKVGFDPAQAQASVKRQVKDQDEAPAAAGPGALFGRVDISSQITKDLLEDMKNESDKVAWKKRAAAMESVQSICEGAGCAIEFTRPVQELLRSLKARLNDSNANLKVKAANVIAIVATSVGPDVGKMSKILGPSLVSGVADNKKMMQTAAIQALHKWVCHNNETSSVCMEAMLSPLSEGLTNTVGRAELLGWAAEHLQKCDKLDLQCLVAPTVQCMMDKSSEAREKAQLVLVEVMKSVGKDVVFTTGCRDIKPAAMRALKPLLEKVSETVGASGVVTRTTEVAAPVAANATPTKAPTAANMRRRASATAPGTPTLKSRLTRPSSLRAPSASSLVEAEKDPSTLLKMSSNKPSRLSKGQYNKWIFDTTSMSEMNARKSEVDAEWKPFLSPEFHSKLFAPSLEKGMAVAMDELMLCVLQQPNEVESSLDLILKWCSLRIVDNNVQALAKLLEVLVKLFEMLKGCGYQLDDVEAAIILPYLLQESGQSKPRFRVRFRDVMKLIVDVYSAEKYVPYLMECFNGSKNIKSRCECIDLVEYIVTVHGYHVLGRRCIKDVGKYVVAHEKEIRESAINALVAVYTRTEGGNLNKFLRLAGVESQQGIDLLTARLKHMPVNTMSAAVEDEQVPKPQQRTEFGRATAVSQLTVPPTIQSVQEPTPMTGVQQFQDDDVDMNAPHAEGAEAAVEENPNVTDIEELLLGPIKNLVTTSNEIVPLGTPAYKEGCNALKGLYAIVNRPSGPAEVEFLRSYVNEILVALCDCIYGAFYAGNAEKRPEMYVLSMSLTTLGVVLNSDALEKINSFTVERILLELCSKILDPRMEKFADTANLPAAEKAMMPPEDKRFLVALKALYKSVRYLTERVKPDVVYQSVIHVLQRLMHNDVGEYNKNDALKHLLKEDSLDQFVGRILIKMTNAQANALNPFEDVNLFGVFMRMHMFFSTLPRAEVMMVDIANDNMQEALRIIAESLLKTRSSALEAAMKDVPLTSPVRTLLAEMGLSLSQQVAAEPTGRQYSENGHGIAEPTTHFTVQQMINSGDASAGSDSINRRLFTPREGGIPTRMTRTASAAPSFAGNSTLTERRSFPSFNEFTANRSASTSNAAPRPTSTTAHLDSLRERLQMSRHFK